MINFVFADDTDACPSEGTYCCSYIEELVRISIKKKRKFVSVINVKSRSLAKKSIFINIIAPPDFCEVKLRIFFLYYSFLPQMD